MDTVTILRDLWRRRLLVVLVVLVAIPAGILVTHRLVFPFKLESRKYKVGVATARVLIDTPSSQVVEVAPKGSDTLGTRANLLASLMVDGVVKSAIAARAGLRPDELVGVSESAAESSPADSSPKPRANVLTTKVVENTAGDQLPIIEIEAQAANAQAAARLADAAVTGMRDYLDTKAALQQVPDAKRLQVSGLGSPQARDVVRGPRDLFAVAAAVLVFLLGCATILGFSALVSGWRAAAREEERSQSEVNAPVSALRNGFDDDHPDLGVVVQPAQERVRQAPRG
jgi:hypothetical protein